MLKGMRPSMMPPCRRGGGGSAIAGLNATAIRNSNFTITGSPQYLPFEDIFGSNNFSLSDDKIDVIVPLSGWYRIQFNGYHHGSGMFEKILGVYINGTYYTETDCYTASNTGTVPNNWVYTLLLFLKAGDKVRIAVWKWDTNTATLYGYSNSVGSHIGCSFNVMYMGIEGVCARRETTPQSVAATGFTKVQLNGLLNNTIGATLTSNEIVVPVSGKYFLVAQAGQMATSTLRGDSSLGGLNSFGLKIQKNLSDIFSATYSIVSGASTGWNPRDASIHSGILLSLSAGDSLGLYYYQGDSRSIYVADNRTLPLGCTYLAICRT